MPVHNFEGWFEPVRNEKTIRAIRDRRREALDVAMKALREIAAGYPNSDPVRLKAYRALDRIAELLREPEAKWK